MRVLETIMGTIAESIRVGHAHPTTVLNTLIEAENAGGLGTVRRIERQLSMSAPPSPPAPTRTAASRRPG